MARPLTLSQMAADLGLSVKTFSKDVIKKQIPYLSAGKRKKFDPLQVKLHLTTTDEPQKVVEFRPLSSKKKRSKVSFKSKCMEAV